MDNKDIENAKNEIKKHIEFLKNTFICKTAKLVRGNQNIYYNLKNEDLNSLSKNSNKNIRKEFGREEIDKEISIIDLNGELIFFRK